MKTAESIEMPFGLMTQVGPRYHVLDGDPIPKGMGNFSGGGRMPIVNQWDTHTVRCAVQKRLNRSTWRFG